MCESGTVQTTANTRDANAVQSHSHSDPFKKKKKIKALCSQFTTCSTKNSPKQKPHTVILNLSPPSYKIVCFWCSSQ